MPTKEDLLLICLTVLGGGTLIGIFITKAQGFGKYTSSLVLLTLVLTASAIALAAGKIEAPLFANIAFAVAGFAGGLVTANAKDS
jgi:hypothetical protein